MPMMNTTGWATPYKVNRPLTQQDYQGHRKPAHKTTEEPTSLWSSIRINEVFMEVVDKAYPFRGVWTFVGVPLFLLCLFGATTIPIEIVNNFDGLVEKGNSIFLIVFGLMFFLVGFGGLTLLLAYLLRKEIFAYSHYPVRLNRQNGMVYVFRNNGANGVLSAAWKDVFWHIAICGKNTGSGKDDYEIRGHVLDADGQTVRDTFSLGMCDELEKVQSHWAHFRGYMVNGTAAPDHLLPIADRKEPFLFGLYRAAESVSFNNWTMVLAMPVWGTMAAARSVAMLTCRAPRWPAHVQAACAVPAGTEPRPQDKVSHVLGETLSTRIIVVAGSLIGGAGGAYFLYWVLTSSGFVRMVTEFFVGRAI
jgi:hypothetical protein